MFLESQTSSTSHKTRLFLGTFPVLNPDILNPTILNPEQFNIGEVSNEFVLKVFGIITQEQFNLLQRYVSGELNGNHKLKREAQKIGIRLLRILQEHKGNKININFDQSNLFRSRPGVALEYFIIELVSRLHKSNGVKIEKGPEELEPNKMDFVITKEGIKYGIQLTTVESIHIREKNRDIKKLRGYCNSGVMVRYLKGKISTHFIPDVPILMVVNSHISRLANRNGVLGLAYARWKKNGYKNTPDYYISNKHARAELKEIGLSLPNVIGEGVKFIKARYWEQKIAEQRMGNLIFSFNGRNNLKISYYSQSLSNTDKQEFIYSIEIFITTKLLKKLGIKHILRANGTPEKKKRTFYKIPKKKRY
ncbi:MAG: hypothetical protein PHE25_00620 [Candidatus Gracilibacteria bacterium]|nr:hypothetical protein [Candidatus Gracilibacteria bacterium]